MSIFGLEIHYKKPNYFWVHLPISDEFLSLYSKYDVKNKSLVDINRLHTLYQFLSYSVKLKGDVAQLGVYKGGSTAVLASLVESSGKRYHAFDTFEGLPKTNTQDNINGYKDSDRTELADTSISEVKKYLKEYACIDYYKGLFPQSVPTFFPESICFVYLDADLYQSTKDGLEYFWHRLVQGGVMAIDDYGGRRWAGVKTAVREFIEANKNVSLIHLTSGQAIIIKTI